MLGAAAAAGPLEKRSFLPLLGLLSYPLPRKAICLGLSVSRRSKKVRNGYVMYDMICVSLSLSMALVSEDGVQSSDLRRNLERKRCCVCSGLSRRTEVLDQNRRGSRGKW